MTKRKKEEVKLLNYGNGMAVLVGKKSIALANEAGMPMLKVTNDYGNSVDYRIESHSFGALWSQLWQFAKVDQH